MTAREVTLDDILAVEQASAQAPIEQIPIGPSTVEVDPNQKGLTSFIKTAAKQDWAPYALARIAAAEGIDWDMQFDLGKDVPEAEWKELTKGLDDDTLERIAETAKSRQHLYFLADLAKESQDREAELASYGGWGVAGRIGASVADPTNVLLAVTTGGVGVASKAERLSKVARSATTLAERRSAVAALGNAAGTSSTRNALTIGTAAALESMALEGLLVESDVTRDGWDVMYAGMGGLVLGAGIGKLLSGREKDAARRLYSTAKAQLETDELRHAIDARRSAITGELGDVHVARAEVEGATASAAAFLGERSADLTNYASFRHALESGGRADAANPLSSAVGIDQFTAGTWKGIVAKAKPKWAEGLTEDQLLAARTDPAKSAEMIAALDTENAAALRKAAAPVNHFTMYAMHHFGTSKGTRFALAPSETMMDDILSPEQLKANPYLRGKTKAQAMANWSARARRAGVDMDGLIDNAPLSAAEARQVAQLESFDRTAAEARLQELEATLRDHQTRVATLSQEAEGILSTRTAADTAADASDAPRLNVAERIAAAGPDAGAKAVRAHSAQKALRALLADDPAPRLTAEGAQLREALGLADAVARGDATDTPRRAETRALVKVVAPKRRALDDLANLDTLASAADVRREHLATTGKAPAFGEDTLSAARAVGFDAGIHPALEGTSAGPAVAQMKLAGGLRLFGKGTFAGVLRGSENEAVRTELGALVGNSLGQVDDSTVAVGASEVAHRIQKTQTGKFNAAVSPAYKSWMEEQGIGRVRTYSRDVRAQFMRELGLHIRGQESSSAAVKTAAERISAVFREFLDEAKAAGVKGFENVEANSRYLPRVFDFHAFHALNTRFGPDQLALLVQKGTQEIYEEIDDATANRVATAYIKRMRELRVGNDAGMLQGMSFDDVGFLRQFLGDAGLASDEVETVVAKFAGAKRSDGSSALNQEGNFRHAKMRQKFDENFTMKLRDVKANDGTTVDVSISDLFENNVEVLFGRYSRTMSGHIGLAKVGIKSRADFNERIRRIERELENDPDQLKDVKRMANAAYDLITARPLEDADLWSELMRTSRDLAFATQMENAGLSNIPDLASLLAWGNFRYTAKAFFGGDVFGALWRRGKDGRLRDELWQEIEETTGLGTDFLNNAVFSSYDVGEEYAEAVVAGKWIPRTLSSGFSAVGHGARVASRAVSAGSGLAAVTATAQRLAARNIIFRIKDDVLKGGRFSDARAAALGLDSVMKGRIAAQLKAHTEWTKGEFGGDIQRVNFDKWDDLDARDAFMYAVHREARKNVQEEDLGDTLLLQHKGWGKVLTQFRRFGLTAWTKQTLRGIAEHDAETFTRIAIQFTLAAGVWKLRHEMVIAGMEAAGTDSEKIEKYRREKLAPDRIAAAGIRNSGWAALMPDFYDTAAVFAFDSPFFDVRNSGNNSHLGGIPTVALAANMGRVASAAAQAAFRGDRQWTQSDNRALQALVPFGHHLMVAPVFEALTAELPERDDDGDPDSVQWFR